MTLHDLLKGVYNRLYFENELVRRERGRDYPVSIISADLVGLKFINEALGQQEGDRVLTICALIFH